MDYRKYQKKKRRLFELKKGKCEYCDCQMVIDENPTSPEKRGCQIPTNLATLDHKYNKDHPLRQTKLQKGERRIFIVCWKCNDEKSKKDTKHINTMKYLYGTGE